MKSPHQADESLVHVVWQTWDTFWSETSISGVSNAGRARGPLRRLAWILIFVVGACFTYWTLNSVVADYRTYPVVTSVSFKHMTDGIGFPAITICNQNRVDCNELSELVTECTTNSSACGGSAQLELLEEMQEDACPSGPPSSMATSSGGRRKRQVGGGDGPMGSADFEAEAEFLNQYMSLNLANRMKIGHTFTDMIRECSFSGIDCLNETTFERWTTSGYGACYTFNYRKNSESLGLDMTSYQPGPFFGLSMVLNIDQSVYMKRGQSKQAGARLVVHDNRQPPLIDEYGIDVQPNTMTQIAINEKQLVRIPAPYPSKCIDSWSQAGYSVVEENMPKLPYSIAQCKRFCFSFMIIDRCSCFHPLYLDFPWMAGNSTLACNLETDSTKFNKTDAPCVATAKTKLKECSRCKVECNEKDYDVLVSSSTWPSDQYLATAVEYYGVQPDPPTSRRKRQTGGSASGSGSGGSSGGNGGSQTDTSGNSGGSSSGNGGSQTDTSGNSGGSSNGNGGSQTDASGSSGGSSGGNGGSQTDNTGSSGGASSGTENGSSGDSGSAGCTCQTSSSSSSTTSLQDKMKTNMLKFNVFFKTLNSQEVEELVKYDLTTTFYAIGGAVSLFLGVSISMFFEIFELIINLILNLSRNFVYRRSLSV